MEVKKVKVYDTSEYKYVIDWGDGTLTRSKTFFDAQMEVKNEALRTIIPRYQNDIIIKLRETGEIKAVLPWIGIKNDDPHYWCPPSKIRPSTYGEMRFYGNINEKFVRDLAFD